MEKQKILEEEGFVKMSNETSLTSVAKDLMPKDFVKKYKQMKKLQAEIEEAETMFKQNLIQMFESIPELETNTVCVDGIKFTYVSPSTRKTVDTKKLQEEMPEVYNKFLKQSNVKSSIRTTIEW